MRIRSYKEVYDMELRPREFRSEGWNLREVLESKKVVTVERLVRKMKEEVDVLVPYTLEWSESENTRDLILPNYLSYLSMQKGQSRILKFVGDYKYKGADRVLVKEVYDTSIAVDDFIADYALAKFRQGYMKYKKLMDKRLREVGDYSGN